MAKLGDKLTAASAAAPPPTSKTPMGIALAGTGAIVYVPVTIRVAGGIPALMRLLGHDEEMDANCALGRRLDDLQLACTPLTADVVEQERARQYMMRALRDPEDTSRAVGSSDDWHSEAITGPVIGALWNAYADHVQTFDPANDEITATDSEAIAEAIQKKSRRPPDGIGSPTLWAYLLSTADRPAPSPTPKSSLSSDDSPTS